MEELLADMFYSTITLQAISAVCIFAYYKSKDITWFKRFLFFGIPAVIVPLVGLIISSGH